MGGTPRWRLIPPGHELGRDGAGALQRDHLHAGARMPLCAELLGHQRHNHEQRREEGKVCEHGAGDTKPCAAAAHEERDRLEVVQRQILVNERCILSPLKLRRCWRRGAGLEARGQTHLRESTAGCCGLCQRSEQVVVGRARAIGVPFISDVRARKGGEPRFVCAPIPLPTSRRDRLQVLPGGVTPDVGGIARRLRPEFHTRMNVAGARPAEPVRIPASP